ncbi:peptidoglycan DD-metalloendopeptidase family protein [Patescibacteria group bacterium]
MLRGGIFLLQKIWQILIFILKPFGKIIYLIFRKLLLPIYNLLYLTKKAGRKNLQESPNALISFFTGSYWSYILIFFIALFVLINNYQIKTVAAEDLGKQSLLYQLAQGDEFEQDIVEEIEFSDEEEGYDRLAKQAEFDFLEPELAVLTKNESIDKEINENALQDTTVAEGLAADALLKSGSPETFTKPQPKENITEYTVQSGDTFSSIAKDFNISINTVLWANDLSGLSIIRPGDKLTILPVTGVLHKVKKGDTLSAISKKYSAEQDKILNFNSLVNESQLSIGQFIIVPEGEIAPTYRRPASGGFASVFKPPSSQKNTAGFIWPTAGGRITQYYHWGHHAIDIGGKTGNPIYASMSGKIIKAGWSSGYGYNVIIDHGNGKKTLYAHLSKIYISRGEQVTQGSVIGALGSTGWSTGPHLHFEIIMNGTKVNPLNYL